jgi:quinol monooxygenase YgiN
MNNRYALINKMTVKPGKRDEVIAILLESGKPFNDNPTCILYLVYKDRKDTNTIWVEDVWASQDDHTAAMSTPAMRSYITKCVALLEGVPEQIQIEPAGGKGLEPLESLQR